MTECLMQLNTAIQTIALSGWFRASVAVLVLTVRVIDYSSVSPMGCTLFRTMFGRSMAVSVRLSRDSGYGCINDEALVDHKGDNSGLEQP